MTLFELKQLLTYINLDTIKFIGERIYVRPSFCYNVKTDTVVDYYDKRKIAYNVYNDIVIEGVLDYRDFRAELILAENKVSNAINRDVLLSYVNKAIELYGNIMIVTPLPGFVYNSDSSILYEDSNYVFRLYSNTRNIPSNSTVSYSLYKGDTNYSSYF